MPNRTYGQYCGLSRALEAVGERWALLIVRDLLVSPKRFTDLRRGLPGIPPGMLSTRLKELEWADVVQRRVLPRPGTGYEYALTPYGYALEETVLALGRWGACDLGEPRSGEVATVDSLIIALRTTFQADAAVGLSVRFIVHVGDKVLHAVVNRGVVMVGAGIVYDPDLVIEVGPALRPLMAGEIDAETAIRNGDVRLTGDRALFDTFLTLFRIGESAAKQNGIGAS